MELVPSTENECNVTGINSKSHPSQVSSDSHHNEISSVTLRPSRSKSTTGGTDEEHLIQHQDYYQDKEFTTVKPYRPPTEG